MAVSRAALAKSATTADPATTLTISKPDSHTLVAGDLLVAFITSNDVSHGVPSGWVAFGGDTLAPTTLWQARLYYRIVTGSEGSSFSWTVGGGGPSAGVICAYGGVDTANPIDSINELIDNSTNAEPSTGPSATAVSAIGRTVYVRAVRRSSAGSSAAVLSTATAGVTREIVSGANALSSTGNTNYSITPFTQDANYSTTGSKSGLAISCSPDETQNYEATFNLRARNEGSSAATIPSVTSAFVGDIPIVSGSIASSIAPAVANMDGIASPPSGSMSTTLSPVTSAFEGSGVGGSTEVTLSPVTSAFAGSVEPLGPISAQLAPVVASFGAETKPFGEHVIRVERDERAFRVTDDDTGLIRILRSQVTDA